MHLQSAIFILLSLSFYITIVLCQLKPEIDFKKDTNSQNDSKAVPVLHMDKVNNAQEHPANALPITNTTSSHNDIKATTQANKFLHGSDDLMQSGALQRGFYVLLGGTLLLLLFLGFRMYRLQKGGNKPNVMVRKYGVLTNRRDVEMLPLPLDEDDEDDTVFEVHEHIENH